MSSEVIVPEDIRELVNEIVIRNNLDSTSNIKYNIGSELGDGFMSKTIAVDVTNQKEELNLFIKYALNAKHFESLGLNKIYSNEAQFYKVIAPAYMEFLKGKKVENGFQNIPKCYGATNTSIVLENLKNKGYQLCDKELVANDEHITLVFKTYAKFHAISFALKDQNAGEYKKLLADVADVFRDNVNEERTAKQEESTRTEISNFLKELDPVKDTYILDRSENLADKVIEFSRFVNTVVFENSVLIQGDCWCNNMMFKYEDDKSIPVDVKLIDWQIIRPASPVIDLAYFYYTAAASSKETLKNLNHFLRIYHEELSTQICKMGSDPEKIYPFSVFHAEWKQFCKFGYTIAYIILKVMVANKDEVPNFEEMDFAKVTPEEVFPVLQRQDEFIDRLRNLTEHFLLNDFF